MRHREPLGPEQLRELDAIDRALAGEPVEDDLRELEDVVVQVRASAPQMSPALAARLERMIEHGPEATGGPVRPRRTRRWVLVPALGTLAAAVVALVVILSSGTGPSPKTLESFAGRSTAGESAVPQRRGQIAPTPSGSTRAAPSSAAGATIAPQRPRRVQRSAILALETPKDKLESTADAVIQTADDFGAIVASSSIAADDASGGEATFDLRVPTSRLDDALAALSKLGHVTQRRQDLQDITASFTSTQDRLDEARSERAGLLKALGNANSPSQIDSLRARLRLVRGQIASDRSQLASLQRRASYSRVSLTLQGSGKAARGGGGSWSPGDAAKDALRVLEVIAGAALIALAVAIPLALLGAAILFGTRVARVRRRESALDAT